MKPKTFRAVIKLWPTKPTLAADLADALRVRDEAGRTRLRSRVEKWYFRDTFPAPFWLALVTAADKRGIKLTYEELAAIAANEVNRAA